MTKKTETIEILRRCVEWRKADLKGWHGIQCSACNKYSRETRYIDGPGFICRHCWTEGDRCTVDNCNEPACMFTDGKCRNHFLVYSDENYTVENFGGFRDSFDLHMENL